MSSTPVMESEHFSVETVEIDGKQAPYAIYPATERDQLNTPCTFMAANGFSIANYDFFLKQLQQKQEIFGLDNRGYWQPMELPDRPLTWKDQRVDLIRFIERVVKEPVHAIGHSLGAGISFYAALERPELFKSLTMIEPATIPSRVAAVMTRYATKNLRKKMIPLYEGTIKRTNSWQSPEEFIDYLKARRAYEGFTEQAYSDYASGGLDQYENEYRLRFDPMWEANNYFVARYIWNEVPKLEVPTTIIRAEHSNLCTERTFKRLAKTTRGKDINLVTIKGASHLVIQQQPEIVNNLVSSWLESV